MNQSFEIIYNQLQIDLGDKEASEQDLIQAIYQRVEYLLEFDKDLLVSYLYRLDISESKINIAIIPAEDGNPIMAITMLIIERQKQRVASKNKYKVKPIEGWEF